MVRALIALLTVALSLAGFTSGAHAQAYPTKPIRIIVPYPAGGTSDILARSIGQKLSESVGQPVIVENKPGANGNVGAEFVARSAADGYTLLLADIGALAISPSVYPKLPFDPAKDFAMLSLVAGLKLDDGPAPAEITPMKPIVTRPAAAPAPAAKPRPPATALPPAYAAAIPSGGGARAPSGRGGDWEEF